MIKKEKGEKAHILTMKDISAIINYYLEAKRIKR